MGKPFWLVWSPAGMTPPRHRHDTEDLAVAEAMRLAEKDAGKEFFVLQPVGVSYAVPPAAEYLPLPGPIVSATDLAFDEPLVPRRDRVLKNGEFEPGDRVRYTGRCPKIARHCNIGALGVVSDTRGTFVGVIFDGSVIDVCYADNLEHETLKSFRVGDRVKVGPDGLRNVREAAGEEATVLAVSRGIDLTFDHPIRNDEGAENIQWGAMLHEIELIRPIKKGG